MRKKGFWRLLVLALMLPFASLLTACFGGGLPTDWVDVKIDNQYDLEQTEQDQVFTSKGMDLVTEINGSFTAGRPFVLDAHDEYKRIYKNIYFYQYDYFYMISNDYDYIWCGLSDSKDLDYAEVEKSQGEDVQVNIKVAGIYNLIFDVKTKTFDLDYVSAITTPVYETIEKCEIGYLDSNKEMQYVAMQKQGDELCVKNVHFAVGKGVGFYSAFTHVSWYKTTMDASCANQLIFKRGTKPNSDIYFMVGGTYNIYLNPETYVVRAELVSADADGYSAYVILDENLDVLDEPAQLSLNDNAINYQFKFQCVAENFQTYSFSMDKIPTVYNSAFQDYRLTLTDESSACVRESNGNYYFSKAGTYQLLIDLQNFTIDVTKLAE